MNNMPRCLDFSKAVGYNFCVNYIILNGIFEIEQIRNPERNIRT